MIIICLVLHQVRIEEKNGLLCKARHKPAPGRALYVADYNE